MNACTPEVLKATRVCVDAPGFMQRFPWLRCALVPVHETQCDVLPEFESEFMPPAASVL